jgi:mannose-6-phosphate isomerase-like protein (cupin superfamily)
MEAMASPHYRYGETVRVSADKDILAPDNSEVRLLLNVSGGGMIHCTLLPYQVSLAGIHQSVEEIWYCLEGQGQIWRQSDEQEGEAELSAGVCVTIPGHTRFQFRNTGAEPLRIIIVTMPPWPGEQEWVRVEAHWTA